MTLRRNNHQSYGDSQLDIREELVRYSSLNGYTTEYFADAKCECGATQFKLLMDENVGVAVRLCPACGNEHGMGDSDEYVDEAEVYSSECLCENDLFEITAGVALYDDSEDVRWIYIGCRCPECSLTGCYGDWKNEFLGYEKLLSNI